jgi:hypothetical protein
MLKIVDVLQKSICRSDIPSVHLFRDASTVATKVNLVPRTRNLGLREKYLLALHSKIRQAGSPASEVAPSGSVANRGNKREVASYAQALRGTRGK